MIDTLVRAPVRDLAALNSGTPGARLPADTIFLAVIALATSSLYVWGLGFYSDDWAFWAAAEARSEGRRLLTAMLDVGMRARPVQAAYLAGLYALFGLSPVGYHVVNAVVLSVISPLLYLWLRRLGLTRFVAIAIPLIFVTLPHFSTARFWIAAFQANAAILFLAACFYADTRWVQEPRRRRWAWKMAAAGAVVLSALAYEMTAALLVLSPLLAWFATRWLQPNRPRVSRSEFLAGATLNLVALLAAVTYKASITARTGALEHLHWWLPYAAREAASVHFGTYGMGMPLTLARVLRDHLDPAALLLSLLLGAAAAVYLLRAQLHARTEVLPRRAWALLAVIGLGMFAAGYAAILTTTEIGFHPTGINNRTAGAAALGTAWTFVAAVGWICAWLPSERARRTGMALALALLVASGTLVTNAIASHWRAAAGEQARIISNVLDVLPTPPSGATILFDGFCRYVGPGIVFETSWDVSGALRLHYGDYTLRGDVISPSTEATDQGVMTIIYDDVINSYPYGEGLIVVNVWDAQLMTLTSRAVAETYIEASAGSADCPDGQPGSGAPIF